MIIKLNNVYDILIIYNIMSHHKLKPNVIIILITARYFNKMKKKQLRS